VRRRPIPIRLDMRILILLAVLPFLLGAKIVPWKTAPRECREENTTCIIYPKTWDPQFYKGPSTREPLPMGKYPRGFFDINSYRADPTDLSGAQWVRLYFIEGEIAWIERQNLLRFSDLKPAKRCWPIKRMHIEAGDSPPGSIVFKPDGTGLVDGKFKVRAWYADEVFSIRYVAPKRGDIDGRQIAWGYLYPLTVVHKSNWIAPTVDEDYFKKTASCRGGPEVE